MAALQFVIITRKAYRAVLTSYLSTPQYTVVVSNHWNAEPPNVDVKSIRNEGSRNCHSNLQHDPWCGLLPPLLPSL